MKHEISQQDRLYQMLNEPVEKLIPKLAVPTIISMLVSAIYNIADTFFVSQISTSASAAVGIIFSLMAFIQAIGFMLGQGSGVLIATSLGRGDTDAADKAAATSFFTAIIIGIIITIFGFIFIKPLIYFLGATDTIYPYALDYCKYILFATPFMMSSFVMNNLLRSEGNAFFAMFGIVIGSVLNIVLDPIFIYVFNWGIGGAAIATMLSQLISFFILLWQSNTRKGCIKLQLRYFTPKIKLYASIIHSGLPSLMRQGLASIATIVLNTSAAPFGDAAIAAMSIVTRIMFLIYATMIGFGQGFQPVAGYNFGAEKYERLLKAFKFCVKVSLIMLTSIGLIAFLLATPIITVFRRDDPEVIAIGVKALKYNIFTLPLQAWIVMCNMLTQSIGYGFRSSLVAMGRQGLFLIPALIALPPTLGILGLQLAQPIADILTFILATIIVVPLLKDFRKKADIEIKRQK